MTSNVTTVNRNIADMACPPTGAMGGCVCQNSTGQTPPGMCYGGVLQFTNMDAGVGE